MVLLKFFKDERGAPNNKVAGIVAFVFSIFIIYGLNKTNLDLENIFFTLGVHPDMLYPIVATILIAGLIFVSWKYGLTTVIMSIGGLLFLGSFVIYDGQSLLFYGLLLFLAGAFFKWAGGAYTASKIPGAIAGGFAAGAKAGYGGVGSAANWAKGKYDSRQEEQQRKKEEAFRQKEQAKAQAEEQEKQQVLQIEANLESMRNSYIKLRKEYDKIFSKDKNDPRLIPIVKQMTELMDAIRRLQKRK
jgi:hypothetical protein